MKQKLLTIVVLLITLVPLFSGITVDSVKGFSTPVFAEVYGVDTTEGRFVQVGSHYIFATDTKILSYTSAGQLDFEYIHPTLTYSDSNMNLGAGYRTSIAPWNNTAILVVHVGIGLFRFGVAGSSLGSGYRVSVGLQAYFLNTETRTNQTLAYAKIFGVSTTTGYNGTYAVKSLSISQFSSNNGTYQNYYLVVGATGSSFYGGSEYQGSLNAYCRIGYTLNANIGQSMTASYKLINSSDTTQSVYNSVLVIPSKTESDAVYLISGNAISATRFSVFKANSTSLYALGSSGIDLTYGGNYYNTLTGDIKGGFVYKMGTYYFNDTTNKLYEINVAFNANYQTTLIVETIIFNETYISQSKHEMFGILTSSYFSNPFAVSYPYGSAGNVSGLYSVGIWTNIPGNNMLTGSSYDLTGIETANPVWAVHEWGFLFTPQLPQTYNFTAGDGFNARGFQPEHSEVGVEFASALGGLRVEVSVVGQVFYNLNQNFNYQGLLTGDFYSRAVIAYHPTMIALKQSVRYTYEGFTYLSGIQSGSGNYTIFSTGLSQSRLVSTTGPYYMVGSAPTGVFSAGHFSFELSPRVSGFGVMYEGVIIQVALTDGTLFNVTYNFGWFQLGASADGLTPYPTATSSGGIDGGNDGGGAAINSNINLFGVVLVPLGLILGIPALLALLLAMLHAGEQIVIIAFFVGLVICFCLAVVTGIVPFWTVYLLAVVLAIVAIVVFSRFFRG